MKNPWLHRSAILVAFVALIVIAMGALLTSEIRPLPGATTPSTVTAPSLERAHRIGGYAVAVLTVGLAVWAASLPGWIAAGAVIVESFLGSAPVMHALLAPVVFSLVIAVVVLTSSSWQAGPKPVESPMEAFASSRVRDSDSCLSADRAGRGIPAQRHGCRSGTSSTP